MFKFASSCNFLFQPTKQLSFLFLSHFLPLPPSLYSHAHCLFLPPLFPSSSLSLDHNHDALLLRVLRELLQGLLLLGHQGEEHRGRGVPAVRQAQRAGAGQHGGGHGLLQPAGHPGQRPCSLLFAHSFSLNCSFCLYLDLSFFLFLPVPLSFSWSLLLFLSLSLSIFLFILYLSLCPSLSLESSVVLIVCVWYSLQRLVVMHFSAHPGLNKASPFGGRSAGRELAQHPSLSLCRTVTDPPLPGPSDSRAVPEQAEGPRPAGDAQLPLVCPCEPRQTPLCSLQSCPLDLHRDHDFCCRYMHCFTA